jgi:hypothetical protein
MLALGYSAAARSQADGRGPPQDGQKGMARCGARCGDWSGACLGPVSMCRCVPGIRVGSGVCCRTRNAAKCVGSTLAWRRALSRRCSDAERGDRSGDDFGAVRGSLRCAMSGVWNRSGQARLSWAC